MTAIAGVTFDFSGTESGVIGDEGLAPAALDAARARLADVIRRLRDEQARGEHAYRNLPFDEALCTAVLDAAARRRDTCDNLVVLGIGGSALGALALHTALTPPLYNLLPPETRGGPRLFVLDNIDPAHVAAVFDFLDPHLDRTLVCVVSKSGQTAETAAQFLILWERLARRLGPHAAARCLIITDPEKGTLRRLAGQLGIDTLPVPPGVGGRFSVLSPVGLFPAAMCGVDIAAVLEGARRADPAADTDDLHANPAARFAATAAALYHRGRRITVMMPYTNALARFAEWFAQLWAESLGKRFSADGQRLRQVGPTPVRAIGATDQHSQLQLYREGPADKLYTLIAIDTPSRDLTIPRPFADTPEWDYLAGATLAGLLDAEFDATRQALLASRRPVITIRLDRLRPENLGALLHTFEIATTLAGRLLDVNPYDQPGVELGKRLAQERLAARRA